MEKGSTHSTINRIGFIGDYLPRQCGIATFTTDLCEAIATEYEDTTCIALPVNDIEAGYAYPARVRFELTEKDIDSYHRAADFLNINSVDLVCLQHEYGIYGGRAGSHILALLRELRMPVVTTLHTILHDPDPDQQRVLEEVAALSDRLVVMSERGREFLQKIYGVRPEKIDFIPHGIPDVPFMDPSFHKDLFGVEGKTVLLSFGLLSANKGIETVIAALPAILARHPNVVYIILGATHPHVVRNEGETYRLSLQWLAQEKGVEGQVDLLQPLCQSGRTGRVYRRGRHLHHPLSQRDADYLGYPGLHPGAGKAVISTPYWYAEEMLAEKRGALSARSDPAALAEQVIDLLDNESKRHAMRKRAYLFGRAMVWPIVARSYMESFKRARDERRHFTPSGFAVKPLDKRPVELPPLKLDHLFLMTDDTGMLQHATFTIPNYREGYSIDDNARALDRRHSLEELGSGEAFKLASRYLAFIGYAFNTETGRFRNFMDYQRHWLEKSGSDDSHGRTLWALGTVLGRSNTPALQSMAGWVFEQALPAILKTTSPRAWAFALIGIHEYLRRFEGDRQGQPGSGSIGRAITHLV